jgi:hypothetical protein
MEKKSKGLSSLFKTGKKKSWGLTSLFKTDKKKPKKIW